MPNSSRALTSDVTQAYERAVATHEIRLLSLIDVFVESSFLVLGRNMGTPVWAHTWGILILGNPAGPILVDTGASEPGSWSGSA